MMLGLIVLIDAWRHVIDERWVEFTIGGTLVGFGLSEATYPVFVVEPEGLFLSRQGFRGSGKLVRWASIREIHRLGDLKIVLGLLDQSHVTLRLWSLSERDRRDFISEIEARSVMANKRIERTPRALS